MPEHSDVSDTLGELERKLKALERELATVERPEHETAPPQPAAAAPSIVRPPPLGRSPAPTDAGAVEVIEEARAQLAELRDQLDELDIFRERLETSAASLLEEYRNVLQQVWGDALPTPTDEPPAEAPTHGSVSGHVTIEAGPFSDIASLSGFEQALGRLPGARDVYVRGFDGDRALIDVDFAEAVMLAVVLPPASPVPVTVTSIAGQQVTVQVGRA